MRGRMYEDCAPCAVLPVWSVLLRPRRICAGCACCPARSASVCLSQSSGLRSRSDHREQKSFCQAFFKKRANKKVFAKLFQSHKRLQVLRRCPARSPAYVTPGRARRDAGDHREQESFRQAFFKRLEGGSYNVWICRIFGQWSRRCKAGH